MPRHLPVIPDLRAFHTLRPEPDSLVFSGKVANEDDGRPLYHKRMEALLYLIIGSFDVEKKAVTRIIDHFIFANKTRPVLILFPAIDSSGSERLLLHMHFRDRIDKFKSPHLLIACILARCSPSKSSLRLFVIWMRNLFANALGRRPIES